MQGETSIESSHSSAFSSFSNQTWCHFLTFLAVQLFAVFVRHYKLITLVVMIALPLTVPLSSVRSEQKCFHINDVAFAEMLTFMLSDFINFSYKNLFLPLYC